MNDDGTLDVHEAYLAAASATRRPGFAPSTMALCRGEMTWNTYESASIRAFQRQCFPPPTAGSRITALPPGTPLYRVVVGLDVVDPRGPVRQPSAVAANLRGIAPVRPSCSASEEMSTVIETGNYVRFERVSSVGETERGLLAELHGERLRLDLVQDDVLRVKISRGGVFDESPTFAVCVDRCRSGSSFPWSGRAALCGCVPRRWWSRCGWTRSG